MVLGITAYPSLSQHHTSSFSTSLLKLHFFREAFPDHHHLSLCWVYPVTGFHYTLYCSFIALITIGNYQHMLIYISVIYLPDFYLSQ